VSEAVARELSKTLPADLVGAPRLTVTAADFAQDAAGAATINEWLESVDAETRVRWSLQNLPGPFALTSSFGAQAAVSLHLVARQDPQIPVILIDTGYLFPETYQFIEQLTRQLSLNIQHFASPQSVAEFRSCSLGAGSR
jgi:phosphoadenosine phosphosulfate reductase